MPAKIVISYRREDSAAAAGRVHDRFEQGVGRESLFMDVDAIPFGVDFVEVLDAEVAKCDVLLAIIGQGWLDARDEKGIRRLDSENDFVRIEIASALKRNIPVIPVLLDGTRMPKAERLPDDLKGLARRNALDVRHASFRADMERLISGLRRTSAPRPEPPAADRTIAPPEPALTPSEPADTGESIVLPEADGTGEPVRLAELPAADRPVQQPGHSPPPEGPGNGGAAGEAKRKPPDNIT